MGIFSKISGSYLLFRERVLALKERSALCRALINKYAIVFIIFLVCICFIDRNSAGVLIRTERTLGEQKEHIEDLENEISTIEQRINRLSSQKDTLEQFAREEYMFHEKGEDIFLSK